MIENDTQGVNIAAIVADAIRLFGCHIFRRANRRAGVVIGVRLNFGFRQAEIGKIRVPIGTQENIGWFDITMQDIMIMRILQRGCDLIEIAASFVKRETFTMIEIVA
ncbi:hypothetical protein KSD_08500 [Ktedonobacter sp. SOSP1-85]|nr:hypothetical protein KSD_08500 [Ktedonobacter sp. SOSP1-85]